jgi:hypothetical protein
VIASDSVHVAILQPHPSASFELGNLYSWILFEIKALPNKLGISLVNSYRIQQGTRLCRMYLRFVQTKIEEGGGRGSQRFK